MNAGEAHQSSRAGARDRAEGADPGATRGHRRSPADPVVIGVVGTGYWGSKHLRVLQGLSGVEIVLVERDRAKRAAMADFFPSARPFERVEDAVDHIDAAIVATPPRSHEEVATGLLQHGRHVLVEKPLATTVAGGEAMIHAADANGAVLMAGHTFEYNPAVAVLRQAIDDDQLGRLHYIDSSRLNLGLYQQDVNVLWDLAPHDISIVNHLLGAEPVQVAVWASAHAHQRLEDVAYMQLQYDSPDVMAHIHVSWLYPRKVRQLAVVGDQRMAVYNDVDSEERIRIYDKSVASNGDDEAPLSGPPMSYRYGGITSPYVDPAEPLALEDQHFVDCIRAGATPRSDGRAGLGVVRVLEAAEEALRSGLPVKVADVVPDAAELAPVEPG